MKMCKRALVVLSVVACIAGGPVAARQQVVQDGIAVKPLSGFRYLAPKAQFEQQSALQYQQLLRKASTAGALYPARDPQVQRLRSIAKRLIPFAPRWNPDAANWNWQVNLLESKEVNAFCMPGGRIAFYSAILEQLHLTDDEVAAVMGHEVAHALREHGRERAGKAATTSIFARLGAAFVANQYGVDPNLAGSVANGMGNLLVLKFSRDEEREADLIGLDLAARAGFDPRAGITLWNKMNALNERQPLALLSTHPGGHERIEQIQNHMNVLLPLYEQARARR